MRQEMRMETLWGEDEGNKLREFTFILYKQGNILLYFE